MNRFDQSTFYNINRDPDIPSIPKENETVPDCKAVIVENEELKQTNEIIAEGTYKFLLLFRDEMEKNKRKIDLQHRIIICQTLVIIILLAIICYCMYRFY